ncbi:MAG: hypothetical protein KJ666_14465 [Bacteroidetes bacterium]|nr:hypothetical protein [Bacteroidota bacterium]MBU2585396.1 hypothetical protein [Bacteroidota bacterium]
MKKIITSFFLLTLLCIPSCINYEQTTWLNSDGSGNMEVHYWTDVSSFFLDDAKEEQLSFKEKQIKKNFSGTGIEVDEIKIWKTNSDSVAHALIKLQFDDINKINQCEFFKDTKIEFVDGAAGQKIFNQSVNSTPGGERIFDRYTISYIYYFPGEIVTDNATMKEKSKLTWSYKLSELGHVKNLTATVKLKKFSSFSDIIIILGILLIVVLWIILIVKKKKKSSAETEAHDIE